VKKILVVLLIVVVAAGAFLFFPRPGGAQAANAATLAVLRGDVDAQHGGGVFAPALDGDILAGGDVVRSNQQGRAVLTFFEGSTLSVEPGSEVHVTSLARTGASGLQVTIEQTIGRTWASVNKLSTPDSRFELKTPTSTAIVRGTTFETTVEVVNGQTVTTVKTGEGEVVVQAVSGGETTVTAGTQVQVRQGQPAPAAPSPQPPTPRLRFSAAPGVGFSVIDPRGLACGSTGALRQIPRCDVAGGTVTVGDVVTGAFSVALTAAAPVADAGLQVVGSRGDTTDVTVRLPVRAVAIGDLVRTTVTVTLAPDGKVGAGAFSAPEQISSVCGAETSGRVFSSGTLDERATAMNAFAAANKGQAAAVILTNADLTAAAAGGTKDLQAPATISNVAITVDNAGLHLTAQATVGPISVTANGDVIAGASNGKLLLKIRSLDLGIVPSAVKDQLIAAVEKQLADNTAGFPLNVTRVAMRPGCLAVMGTTR